jgi:hypothetical protein
MSWQKAQAKALLIVGIAAIEILTSIPSTFAADLGLRRARTHHGYGRVVADYDGTAIYLRRARAIVANNYDGTQIVRDLYVARPVLNIDYPVMGPIPRRYLNGQPYP